MLRGGTHTGTAPRCYHIGFPEDSAERAGITRHPKTDAWADAFSVRGRRRGSGQCGDGRGRPGVGLGVAGADRGDGAAARRPPAVPAALGRCLRVPAPHGRRADRCASQRLRARPPPLGRSHQGDRRLPLGPPRCELSHLRVHPGHCPHAGPQPLRCPPRRRRTFTPPSDPHGWLEIIDGPC